MDPRYSAEVHALFRDRTRAGSLPSSGADVGTGEASSEDSSERVRLQIRIGDDARIETARFKAFGCPVTIASAAYVAQRIEGRATDVTLSAEEISDALSLSGHHAELARLPLRALEAALSDQRAKGS